MANELPCCGDCGSLTIEIRHDSAVHGDVYSCRTCGTIQPVTDLGYTDDPDELSLVELRRIRRLVLAFPTPGHLLTEVDRCLAAKAEPLLKLQCGIEDLEKAVERLRVALNVLKEGV